MSETASRLKVSGNEPLARRSIEVTKFRHYKGQTAAEECKGVGGFCRLPLTFQSVTKTLWPAGKLIARRRSHRRMFTNSPSARLFE